jgi:hypothetical protein
MAETRYDNTITLVVIQDIRHVYAARGLGRLVVDRGMQARQRGPWVSHLK